MPFKAYTGVKSSVVTFKNKTIATVTDNCVGCQMCQIACSWIKQRQFNASKAYIDIQRNTEHEGHWDARFTESCDACGYCDFFCHYDAIHLDTGKERA